MHKGKLTNVNPPRITTEPNIGRILTDIDNKIAINRRINDNLPKLDHSLKGATTRLVA